MAISDLQPKQGKVDIVVEIVDKGNVREFDKFGKKGRVCTATAKDTSGEIKLSLWNEQVDQVKVGDIVKITNGYVSEFQGEKQLSTGKFGSLEIVEKGKGSSKGSEGVDEIEKELAELEKNSAKKPKKSEEDEGEHILTKDEKEEEEILDEGKKEKPYDDVEDFETEDEEEESEEESDKEELEEEIEEEDEEFEEEGVK